MSENQRPTEELLALIWPAMDHGISSIKDIGGPLIPFIMFEQNDRTREVHRYMVGRTPWDSVLEARKSIAALPSTAVSFALVYDGSVTITGEKSSAVLVEAAARGCPSGFRMFQRFRPKGFLHSFKPLGNPGLLGICENWFDANSTVKTDGK